jgi:alkylhydroperoxidase/carboxymuconolactone decarboxylase family protein YurZ
MKANIISILTLVSLLVPFAAFGLEENKMDKNKALNEKEKNIISIAAFTASGDLDRLKPALNNGLDAGLTINEIKEVMVHLYAYTGFPRSLNALSSFMQVLDERKAKGIKDVEGKVSSPVPPDLDKDKYGAKVRAKLSGRETDISGAEWQKFSPAIDTFLKEHLFADLFVRDVISYKYRELATIAALANVTGTKGQLGFHIGAAMNTGWNRAQMEDFVLVVKNRVGKEQGKSAENILEGVLKNRT